VPFPWRADTAVNTLGRHGMCRGFPVSMSEDVVRRRCAPREGDGRRRVPFPAVTVALVLLTAFLAAPSLGAALGRNLGNVVLDRSLWRSGVSAESRARSARVAARLYGLAACVSDSASASCKASGMIPAILQADSARRNRRYAEASSCLRLASTSARCPAVQGVLAVPSWVVPQPDGSLLLAWDQKGWRIRRDTDVVCSLTVDSRDYATFGYSNRPGHIDNAILQWSGPVALAHWDSLLVYYQASVGTSLTMEAHTDSGVHRFLSYEPGDGRWHAVAYELQGAELLYV